MMTFAGRYCTCELQIGPLQVFCVTCIIALLKPICGLGLGLGLGLASYGLGLGLGLVALVLVLVL